MNSDFQDVIFICQQLQAKGTEPTTAMIRAKLGRPMPLPKIIQGLRRWQAEPNVKVNAPVAVEEEDTNNDAYESATQILELKARISCLEQSLKALQAEVADLKQQ
jgi:hypothetical protein